MSNPWAAENEIKDLKAKIDELEQRDTNDQAYVLNCEKEIEQLKAENKRLLSLATKLRLIISGEVIE